MIQRQKKLQLKKRLEMLLDKVAEKKKDTTWSKLKNDVFCYFNTDEVWKIAYLAMLEGYKFKRRK